METKAEVRGMLLEGTLVSYRRQARIGRVVLTASEGNHTPLFSALGFYRLNRERMNFSCSKLSRLRAFGQGVPEDEAGRECVSRREERASVGWPKSKTNKLGQLLEGGALFVSQLPRLPK